MNIPRCIRTLAKPLELVIQTGKLGKLNFRMLWWIKACYLAICIIPSAVKAAKAAATSTAAAELATPAASTTGDVCKQSQTCANGCQWIKAWNRRNTLQVSTSASTAGHTWRSYPTSIQNIWNSFETHLSNALKPCLKPCLKPHPSTGSIPEIPTPSSPRHSFAHFCSWSSTWRIGTRSERIGNWWNRVVARIELTHWWPSIQKPWIPL